VLTLFLMFAPVSSLIWFGLGSPLLSFMSVKFYRSSLAVPIALSNLVKKQYGAREVFIRLTGHKVHILPRT
jgi:hypothetical protein